MNTTTSQQATSIPVPSRVGYEIAARRHMTDAESLFGIGRLANAGQLYGFVAECGLKAMLLACGVQPDTEGGIPSRRPAPGKGKHPMREHVPLLMDNITADFQIIPDGVQATRYLALVPNRSNLDNWSIEHRYWRDTELPIVSVSQWRAAASEITSMLDQAKQDGVLS